MFDTIAKSAATATLAGAVLLGAVPQAFADGHATNQISAEFPFEKSFVEVNGSKMAYVDEGEGPVVLFLHGNPTSSYLWRNIIPFVADDHRAIALDLIGMGDSDKPEIDYTYQDHYAFVEGFIDAMDLTDITLVVHDWGGGLGTFYAANHSDNVRAIAMMEAAAPPGLPVQSWDAVQPEEIRKTFQAFRDPQMGPELIIKQNVFVEQLIPGTVMRPLSEIEMDAYRAPFVTEESRKPVLQWPNEIPIEGEPARNIPPMMAALEWLTTSPQPKLVFYVSPGFILPPQAAEWVGANFSNVETRFLGAGVHFVQEDHPELIGRNLSDWLRDRVN